MSYSEQNRLPSLVGSDGDLLPTVHSPRRDPTTVNSPQKDPTTVNSPRRDPTTVSSPRKDPTTVNSPWRDPTTVNNPRRDPTTVNSPRRDLEPVLISNQDLEKPSDPAQTSESSCIEKLGLENLRIQKLDSVVVSSLLLTAETPIVKL